MPGDKKCGLRGGVAFCGTKVNVGMDGVIGGKPWNGDTGIPLGAGGKEGSEGEGKVIGPG